MLGKVSLSWTSRDTEWSIRRRKQHTHKSYSGLKYCQARYQNLKDKVELLPLRCLSNKTEGFPSWFGSGGNLPVVEAGSTLENIDQHPHFADDQMEA